LKKPIRYLNFFLFVISLAVLVALQSYTHFSTSLFSVLPQSDAKKMIEGFQKTQNSQTLLVSVKGFDESALERIQQIEIKLDSLESVSLKVKARNHVLAAHNNANKLMIQDVNVTKLTTIDVAKTLKSLYHEMTSSFFPVIIDKIDPFKILISKKTIEIQSKNGHAILGDYGYMSYFTLQTKSLKDHKKVYDEIHDILRDVKEVQFFSPLFYYVENSEAIRSDVQNIMTLAFIILLLLYIAILKDVLLLVHTVITLSTSAMLATVMLSQMYEQISIFVFVFGVSISTVAIDYMFHHYLHGYYSKERTEGVKFNREVLFGFLTTFFAFFILSFTSFLLIKQIAFFAMVSLFISYIHFAFLYPKIGFKTFIFDKKKNYKVTCSISSNIFLFISFLLILASSMWVHFDFNLKNLDYDNQTLKKTEHFFESKYTAHKNISFAIQADTIDSLISKSKRLQASIPTAKVPLSSLMSSTSYGKNKDVFLQMHPLKSALEQEANKLGFKKGYFDDAYTIEKSFSTYTQEQIKSYGIEILKIDNDYITFGIVNEAHYKEVLAYDFVKSLSIKEHFELLMQESVKNIGVLGVLVILMIVIMFLILAGNKFVYATIFLLFPVTLMGVYAYFFSINILHLFMLFIILAIGIDYAIYMATDSSIRTRKAISYSLVSTFAGFGVLVFSQINALFSLGIIAIIGIGAISMLLLCMKEV